MAKHDKSGILDITLLTLYTHPPPTTHPHPHPTPGFIALNIDKVDKVTVKLSIVLKKKFIYCYLLLYSHLHGLPMATQCRKLSMFC